MELMTVLAGVRDLPQEQKALLIMILGCVLLVIIDRWLVARFFNPWIQRRLRQRAGVVDLSRERRSRLRSRAAGSISPLWLLVFAAGIALWSNLDRLPFAPIAAPSGNVARGQPGPLAGRVTHVRDRDTIEVAGRAIRLNGLTCDERDTPLGDAATRHLRDLALREVVTCRLNGERTYDRDVGRCALPDGRDIGAVMIEAQLCGRCARYDPRGDYVAVQREAGRFQGSYPRYCLP